MITPLRQWSSHETLQTFHEGESEVWHNGRKVQKSRYDMKRLEIAIRATQPEAIIETGTRYGGSAGFLSDVSKRALVVSIDVNSQLGWTGRNIDTHQRNIRYVDGSSTDPEIVEMVADWVKGKKAMVVLDSDHHAPHVLDEIRAYSKLVSPDSFMVVEDGCFDMWKGDDARRGAPHIETVGGPIKAIREWLYDDEPWLRGWRRAIEIECLYPVSHSPCGWWQFDPDHPFETFLQAGVR